MDDPRLAVSEIFGPTFQGEGLSAGRRCAFVRLGHCNLHCSWCDADYTWRYSPSLPSGYTGKVYDVHTELRWLTAARIVDRIEPMGVDMVVISGGEPLVQHKRLEWLTDTLAARNYWIEIETNGTIAPPQRIVETVERFNVSPKLSNSGNGVTERFCPGALARFLDTERAIFKFVVTSPDDLVEIDRIVAAVGIPRDLVWLMPEGCSTVDVERHAQAVADAALRRGWNMTMRMQIAIWGDRRGV